MDGIVEERTTVCFGPLPREDDLAISALVRLLDEKIEGQYDFLLVQCHKGQRWCYLNFRDGGRVFPFVRA